MTLPIYFILLVAVSAVTLLAFAIDKKNSSNEANARMPEMVLLSLTTFGGAIGALIGIYVLRHKSNFVTKFHFGITVWLSAIVQAVIAVLLIAA